MIESLAFYLVVFIGLAIISASLTNFIIFIFNLDGGSEGAIFAKLGNIFTAYFGYICPSCFSVWVSWFVLLGAWGLSEFYMKMSLIFAFQVWTIAIVFPAVSMFFLLLLSDNTPRIEK